MNDPRLPMSFLIRNSIFDALIILWTAMVMSAGDVCAQETSVPLADKVLGESIDAFLSKISRASGHARDSIVTDAVGRIRNSGNALVTDSSVCFLYAGRGENIFVPSDINGWQPLENRMIHIEGSDIFYLILPFPGDGRLEYKFVVDSMWIMDPVNPRKALGGYGFNSELWMPGYEPPSEILERNGVRRGSLDTLYFHSDSLGRTHPVFIYLPFGYSVHEKGFGTLWVTDGGEYLTLGLMKNVLDNMIYDGRINPVVAIFVDPRTDPTDSRTSKRMEDYAPGSPFLNALILELRPQILSRYRAAESPSVIMGASMGGLFSTYASVTRPDIFSGAAAQSPAYWWDNGEIFNMVREQPPKTGRFYIDTGTIRDAQVESLQMYELLRKLGCEVEYAEYPEGHNPVNWRARIDEILEYFFRPEQ